MTPAIDTRPAAAPAPRDSEGSSMSAAGSPNPASRARPVRAIFLVLGSVFLALAALGVIVPVLPTTPFVLLAAACFLRASTRLHAWLLGSQTFGPTIVAWQEHRAIPPRAKALAIIMVAATFAFSVLFVIEPPIVRAVLAAVGLGLIVWLARRPSWTPLSGVGETGGARPIDHRDRHHEP